MSTEEKWLSVNGKFHEYCKQISEALEKANDLQTDVAKVANTDQSMVSRVASGYFRVNKVRKITDGTWQKIVRIGTVYGIPAPVLSAYVRGTPRPRRPAPEARPAAKQPVALDRTAILRLAAEGKLSIDTAAELLDVVYGAK